MRHTTLAPPSSKQAGLVSRARLASAQPVAEVGSVRHSLNLHRVHLVKTIKFSYLLLTTGLLLLPLRSVCDGEYKPITPRNAHKALLHFCRTELEYIAKQKGLPKRQYQMTFERAEAGDIRALKTIFFDPEYLGGEDENHDAVPGLMCIAAGDRRITAFLQSLPLRERRDALDQIIRCFIPPAASVLPFTGKPAHEPAPEEIREAHRWLDEHFPRMSALNKDTPLTAVLNHALQRKDAGGPSD